MKLKLAVAALALVIATPTFAGEYYVIQSASNKKCSIASKKPTSDKMTLVGDGAAYKTKKEARTALKVRRRLQGLIAACARPRAGHRAARDSARRHASLRRRAHPSVGREAPALTMRER